MRRLFRYFLGLLSFYIKNNISKYETKSSIINNEIIERLKKKIYYLKSRKKTHNIFNKEIEYLIKKKKINKFFEKFICTKDVFYSQSIIYK
jgi:hypothetical protein